MGKWKGLTKAASVAGSTAKTLGRGTYRVAQTVDKYGMKAADYIDGNPKTHNAVDQTKNTVQTSARSTQTRPPTNVNIHIHTHRRKKKKGPTKKKQQSRDIFGGDGYF